MKRRRRKSAKCMRYLLGGNGTCLRRSFPAQEIGQHGARSDRRDASLRLEARNGDAAGFNPNSEPQHIAADWICHFDYGCGAGKIARIVRIAEMLEHNFVEHGRQYKAERRTLNVRVRDIGVQYCTLYSNGFSLRFSFESD
jgi:hypothetical protein